MAQIQESGGQGDGKKRAKKQSTQVDMTPLVDLAFLLLTFFVLTSTFSKPKVLRMIFPEKLEKDNPNVKPPEVKNGLTILLTENDQIYYYNGALNKETEMIRTDYTKKGLRSILVERNAPLIDKLKKLQIELGKANENDTATKNRVEREAKEAQIASKLVVLVKHSKDATYENVIDVVDEFLITQVAKYFVVDEGLDLMEEELIKNLENE
ncbi:MAG: biopolymer transporter ExbD [Bacteroidia bacterium]|jgi:biopolymer transport protein ExbD|nr:biopolymer transporter ExbD [Bacteroidia bacterium]